MLKRYEKVTAYGMLALLIFSLLPIICLGRYNHPTGDDYYYGVQTRQIWEETGSLLQTLKAACEGTVYQYHNWQGTYSAMLLMYLPPNIFGDWAYRCVTGTLLLLLTGGCFYLTKPVMCRISGGSVELWVLTASLLSLLWIQTVPSQGEAFFWYNGSMYYTGYFAVTLFFFGVVLRYLIKPAGYRLVIMLLLAAFLAGGNYVSLLPAIMLMAALTGYLIYRRSPKVWAIGATTVVLLFFLGVSAAAPGNAVRQSGMWKLPAWKAVAKSLLQGMKYTEAWLGGWWVLAAILLTPLIWKWVSGLSFKFPFPVIVTGLMYGTFCAMSCPLFYTMNSTGPARAVAIVYYGFILFSLAGYIYFLGWLNGKLADKGLRKYQTGLLCKTAAAGSLLLLGVLLCTGSTGQLTTVKAMRLLENGVAEAYEQEYQERLRILEDESITDVVFMPYENQPDMLYVGDFSGDAMDDTNQKTAQYFKKHSVRVWYE